MISWKKAESNLPKRFCMVGTRYFASATNGWYSIWYHNYGRTWSITSLPGLVFRRRREVLPFWRSHRPRKRAALVMWCGWFKLRLENRQATSLTTGAKHWHRQKTVFLCFCFFDSIHDSATMHKLSPHIFYWTVFIHWTQISLVWKWGQKKSQISLSGIA